MPDTLSNQALSTLRARQNAGGGAAGLAAPITATLGPTAVPANINPPATLATANVPPSSPQASGLVSDQGAIAVPLPAPAQGPVAEAFGNFGQRIAGLQQQPALAPPAPVALPRSTAFGRQTTDQLNPTSLF